MGAENRTMADVWDENAFEIELDVRRNPGGDPARAERAASLRASAKRYRSDDPKYASGQEAPVGGSPLKPYAAYRADHPFVAPPPPARHYSFHEHRTANSIHYALCDDHGSLVASVEACVYDPQRFAPTRWQVFDALRTLVREQDTIEIRPVKKD